MMDESITVAGMTQRKSAQFIMRIDPELKAAAIKAAADDRRSLAGLVERLLEEYCRQYGYLKPERRLGIALVEPEPQRKATKPKRRKRVE
jgi:hypothetical protein